MIKRILLPILIALVMVAGVVGLFHRSDEAKADFTVVSPGLTLQSATIYPSQNYVLTATGFSPSERVELAINGVRLAYGVANGSGQYTSTVKIPTTLTQGSVTFRAKNDSGIAITTTTATLNPVLLVSSDQGSSGAAIRVQGFGFDAVESYTVTFTSDYNASESTCIEPGAVVSTTLVTGTTSTVGSFNSNATIPDVADGTYYLTGRGQSSAVCVVN